MRKMVLITFLGGCTIEVDADPAQLAAYCAEHIGEYPCPPLSAEQSSPNGDISVSDGNGAIEGGNRVVETTTDEGYFFAHVRWDIVDETIERLAFDVETHRPGCRVSIYQDRVELQVDGEMGGSGIGTLVWNPGGLAAGTYGANVVDASVRSVTDRRMNTSFFAPESDSLENEFFIESFEGTKDGFVAGTFYFRRLCQMPDAEASLPEGETPRCLGELDGRFFCAPQVFFNEAQDELEELPSAADGDPKNIEGR